mgnify:CR=1 FL=1
MVSYFGRINYDYASKYIVSLNYRRDGYSALSEKNRWGNFGGVSAAWRVSEEGFFNPLRNVVDDLKIKGSYGVLVTLIFTIMLRNHSIQATTMV